MAGDRRPETVIRSCVTMCEFFCLAIRYALVPLAKTGGSASALWLYKGVKATSCQI